MMCVYPALLCLLSSLIHTSHGWHASSRLSNRRTLGTRLKGSSSNDHDTTQSAIFDEFCSFLLTQQEFIISGLEKMDGSGQCFTNDKWGAFASSDDESASSEIPKTSGGKTRVLQGGNVIEKGACSLTLIRQGLLSEERAAAISSRQGSGQAAKEGDVYSACALSIVLHSKSPLVPTFRSDVRIFFVESGEAWFGGGADLTPYYLDYSDITDFHQAYKELAETASLKGYSYQSMKKACDDYFYLPARSEHRGTGGIFFDDLTASPDSLDFVKGVAELWLPSWLPIVEKYRSEEYSEKQRHWQLLRRGRYLEFNLLYDRGVKFGLANANPRVEGVMVSAPPLIAWEYNYPVEENGPEEELMKILKQPKEWV